MEETSMGIKTNTYPVVTKENQKGYKNDPLYQDNLRELERYKEFAKNDMELKHLISYVKSMVNLCFFTKHNRCLFNYNQEEMLSDAFRYLENYGRDRYFIQ